MDDRQGEYKFSEIEAKWQDFWESNKTFRTLDCDTSKPKYYALIEFPYPSSQGLHVGHPRSYTAMDVLARKRRMQGYNVLFPIGWDAFGLPAENYAIKTGVHPRESTNNNITNFKRQLQMLGLSFDWDREVNTSEPEYYKWTQWMFVRFFKKGLAYKAEIPINWCTSCKVGLSNEEVVDGCCERCGAAVTRKMRKQWMLRITQYAERLIDDLGPMDYLERIKAQQTNWIGKSVGAEVDFKVDGFDKTIRVFTTRPDTLFGATYMVLAPEHSLVDVITTAENKDAVKKYIEQASMKSDLDRTDLAKEKTGQFIGAYAVNPVNDEKIPIWISDYVLISYGTGAIMAVPAHDERDFEFATKFGLPIIEVVKPPEAIEGCYSGDGVAINSGEFDGMSTKEFKEAIASWLEEKGLGEKAVNYKLRDWVFSRQRYWGEPIPLVECQKCGMVALPDEQLPLVLPDVDKFEPSEEGDSLLAGLSDWVNTTCPDCGGPAKREVDTMPQWAGSCWYFLRYVDPTNKSAFASKQALDYWMPVDWYNGGMEHTTLHLLYSRFWNKFLYDEKLVPVSEPYSKRTSHGMILGADNEKMSKSRGNVVNPDEIVTDFGADTFRLYEMFIGAFDQAVPWSTQGVTGTSRFLQKVWRMIIDEETGEVLKAVADSEPDEKTLRLLHRTIKKVGDDIEGFGFNTAISQMMIFVNHLGKQEVRSRSVIEKFLFVLSPFAPHIAEELWQRLGHEGTLAYVDWPEYDSELIKEKELELAVQVLGKIKDRIVVSADASEDAIKEKALASEKVQAAIAGKTVRKVIVIKNRLVNIVAS